MSNSWKYIIIISASLIADYCLSCQCHNYTEENIGTNDCTHKDQSSLNNDIPAPPSTDNSKRLEAAQTLAANLDEAVKLTGMYTALANQVKSKTGSNNDHSFIGIAGMQNALRSETSGGNLSKFKKWAEEGSWKSFHNEHYDWWMFPLDQNTASKGMKYTVFADQIKELKKDNAYLKDYRLGVILLMMSWGWDMKNQCFYNDPGNQQAWTGYQVRLGKLAYSLILFQQWDLYESVEKFVLFLKDNKGFVKSDHYVKTSFPNI